jgi:hypothetical protein
MRRVTLRPVGVFLACAAFALAVSSFAADEYKLQYKFFPGQTDKYVISGEGKMTLKIQDEDPVSGDAKVTMEVARFIRRVSDAGDINYVVYVSSGEATVLDNKREIERQRGPLITMAPTGKIKEIDPPEEGKPGFEPTRLKEILDYPVVMPDHEIKVGDSWETESRSGLKIDNTLTKIEEVDGVKCAVLETKASGSMHDAPATLPAPEGPVKLDLTVSNNTVSRYELETGRLVDSNGDVSIEAKGTRAEDATPFQLEMTMKVTVKKAAANDRAVEAKPKPPLKETHQGLLKRGKDE